MSPHIVTLSLNSLPVSLYFELHEVLYMQMILNGRVDIKPSALLNMIENESTRQDQRKELAVNGTRKRKSVKKVNTNNQRIVYINFD